MVRYFKNWRTSWEIFKSKRFNINYYTREYPEVKNYLNKGMFYRLSTSKHKVLRMIGKSYVHPIRHYVWHGVYEGKNPTNTFDTAFYIENNPDVAHTGMNPFYHYINFGKTEGRKAKGKFIDYKHPINTFESEIEVLNQSVYFDRDYYLAQNIDVAEAKLDPVEHYCLFGWKENRNPSELFDTRYYLENNSNVAKANQNPLYHFIIHGEEDGLLPSARQLILSSKREQTIVFIGHEAEQTGAPIILLDIVNWFQNRTSYRVKVILLRGGKIEEEYKNCADTLILNALECAESDMEQHIEKFIGSNNRLYFLNTVVSAQIFDLISNEHYPTVAYIHELEKTMNMFPRESALLKKNVRTIIAASDAVKSNLIANHNYLEDEVKTVFAFIKPQHQFLSESDRMARRIELGLRPDCSVVFSCGVLYWRKNPKGFIDVAEKMLNNSKEKYQFVWIGDGEQLNECQKLVKKKKLDGYIRFIGSVDNPRDYFAAGDLFMLTAIEDPFPLVCLEAAECGVPIICFDNSGGMPGFVAEDAGTVVPMKDTSAMANAAIQLLSNSKLRTTLGQTARQKVLERHVINNSAQSIKRLIDKKFGIEPYVTVIVPNYNHSEYLKERLDSIYNQSYQDVQVILMDDVSSDNSREILDSYANQFKDQTIRLYNDMNSGSVFLQWKKGIETANSDIIWIAESDDYSDKDFLEKLLPAFSDENVVLSYSNSKIIGSKGQYYNSYDNIPWLTELSATKWSNNYKNTGIQEFYDALAIKCTIPNISGTLIKKEVALKIIDVSLSYKKAGDWIFYSYLSRYGDISYIAEPLNYHRRHEGTVTSKEGDDKGVEEIFKIHSHFVNNFYIPNDVRSKMIQFIESEYTIYKQRNSVTKRLDQLYIKEEILYAPSKPKIGLFQHGLNFGKGGAEKMLIEIANQLFARGYDVTVFNKTFSDEQLPYKLNSNIPVVKVGINQDIAEFISHDSIDICIMNAIGHPDSENIEQFQRMKIPVVLSMHNEPKFFDQTPGESEHMKALKKADCIVTLVPSFKEEYLSRGISVPIEVVPNFVIKPKLYGEFKGLGNRRYILTVGRLAEQKQQNVLIDAFAQIAEDYPDWALIIAGEGNLRPDLEEQIQRNNISDRVMLIGEVENIGDYYSYCDLFVLPSKYEGFGLVVFEAASYGKPVMVFKDCPPYGEILSKEEGVILVNEMTRNALARELINFITKSSTYEVTTSSKITKLYNKYAPSTILDSWETLLKSIWRSRG